MGVTPFAATNALVFALIAGCGPIPPPPPPPPPPGYRNQVREITTFNRTATVNLWEQSQVITNSDIRDEQRIIDSKDVKFNPGFNSFAMFRGPGPLLSHHFIGITVELPTGPMFRAGNFPTLPVGAPENKNGFIDIMMLDVLKISEEELNAKLPATPFTDPKSGIVVTSVRITTNPATQDLTLTLGGPQGRTTYTFVLRFAIKPSVSVKDTTEVFEIQPIWPASLTFEANPGGGVEAFFKNALSSFFSGKMVRDITYLIYDTMNTFAQTEAARKLHIEGPAPKLPPEIVLSAHEVRILADGNLAIAPTLGSFGNLILRIVDAIPPGPPDKPVSCTVFDDGVSNESSRSDAITFSGPETACIPDNTSHGLCRRWFGRCVSTKDNVQVSFKVFDDGSTHQTPSSGAVLVRAPNIACIPDGTSQGSCRRWFGLASTADGRAVQCYLFDDGNTNRIGPTQAIYYREPGQVCMPDGTSVGACRKWFGTCRVGD
jgi:hypothetical protein